jgi:hypothetical protein
VRHSQLKELLDMATEEFLSTQAASEYLSKRLPEKTMEQWSLWLHNNRNLTRRAIYRIKTERLGRMTVYTPEELAAFIEFEKSRSIGSIKLTGRAAEAMRAFGLGEAGGGMQGRRFKGGSASPQPACDSGQAFVQAVINEPLMVFTMSPEEAISFGRELTEAGQVAKNYSIQQSKKSDLNRYETVFDNRAIEIKRKVKK